VDTTGSLREHNRRRIVEALRRRGSASRTELARATGLSRTTVASLVAELSERGLVIEGPRPGKLERGRPPVLLTLDPAAGAAVGVDFGHRHMRVAVGDLACTVLAERTTELDVDHAATEALDAAVAAVPELLEEAGVERSRVIGVGMGLPGPIDLRTGAVGSSVILPGWSGLNAGEALAERLELPVEVDNDANLGALAESSFGAGRGLQDVVYVKISSGIGAGLILGGRLHRGATGIAGELGHVQVRADGAVCRCGNRGCLETIAAVEPLLALLRPAHGDELGLRGMLGLVAGGDPGAGRLVNDAGRGVGRVLADLCNTLNPAAIVVGGDLSAAGEPLLEGVREAIARYAQPGVAAAVEVRRAELGERAEVLGALALVVGDPDRLRTAGLDELRPAGARRVAATVPLG
jgi:predicted NBD/HSP70 family sugar kinase